MARPAVLLATCQALLITLGGNTHRVRILIDQGSELSFISESAVQRLKLKRQPSCIPITGIGDTYAGQTRGSVFCRLQSIYSEEEIQIYAQVFSRLLTKLPSFNITEPNWAHLKNLQLADPDFFHSREVDMVLGADGYGLIIKSGVIKATETEPVAQHTIFGWIVSGIVENSNPVGNQSFRLSVSHEIQDIHELLTRFWVQEEVPQTNNCILSPEEKRCEEHFVSTHSRDSTGRYTVRLPFKEDPNKLGDSLNTARGCLKRLLYRLSADAKYSELYRAFLREYEDYSHMKKVAIDSRVGQSAYYLPHHGVLREDSETTKLRVVFNGSSRIKTNLSLNDILHSGPKIQIDIFDVLLWVRRHRYIFATDIKMMFRQINVHRDDWDFQRILWVSENKETAFQLTTVTYGTTSAPYLAVRVLLQLILDEGEKFPLAISPMKKGRYVDDIFGGADNFSTLIEQANQLIGICKTGGFPLAKWQSNHPDFLKAINVIEHSNSSHSFEDDVKKLLGLKWLSASDKFTFSSNSHLGGTITKRIILSEVAQLYDPLGFLSPFIIRAKALLQELWLEKLSWDDLLSPQLTTRWENFRRELNEVGKITIPRWINHSPGSSVEFHGFSDASQLAMAAAVYIRVHNQTEKKVSLVCAKSKVAPLKRLTIPRLELTAALLLAKLIKYVQETLELKEAPVILWTDSSVALSWINSHPSRWKEFVRNRVEKIQELVPQGQWKLISGRDNPADCATRGLTISQLERHHLWWNGPPWLTNPSNLWPTRLIGKDSELAVLEERPGLVLTSSAKNQAQLWDLIFRYSSLTRLLRITAICQRVRARLTAGPQTSLSTPLNPGDLEEARLFWIREIQREYFSHEIKIILSGQTLPKTHSMTRLTAFVDHGGILRVGGRLKHSMLPPESKHPAILPRDSPLSRLIISEAHSQTLHGGTQLTLSTIREKYWIIGGRAPVRSYILRCIKCARQRGVRAQQLMGQLPHTRVTPSRPFLNTGVDYAGPVTLKTWRGRGAKTYKAWLCIFVCFSTSAIHLELVTNYTADGFIAAYRRFAGRRGICRELYSDCGTTFVGANTEIKKLFTAGTQESNQLGNLLTNDGTHWNFNPPAAPHMGGKWEAAVKSVKYHLNRTIADTALTYEEHSTLLTQVEALLNSRPLEPLSEDPDDLEALTPGHFLIGSALNSVPEPSLIEVSASRLSHWQLIQRRTQEFWTRWAAHYLHRLQAISKWHHPSHKIRVGSLVLLTDERFPPSKWPLARIIALHPGKDGHTRVVTLRTAVTTLDRPITKIAVLPVYESSSNLIDNSVADGGENVPS